MVPFKKMNGVKIWMNIRSSAWKIAILVALLHGILGNMVGACSDGKGIKGYLFLPYTFIHGMSAFAGWSDLSILLEIISFALMTILFYPVGLFLQKSKVGKDKH